MGCWSVVEVVFFNLSINQLKLDLLNANPNKRLPHDHIPAQWKLCARGKSAMLELKTVAAVAQLDRVLGYEPRGRGFESCQPHHLHLSH